MSAAPSLPFETGTALLPRKRFTREEVQVMMDLGWFAGQRYELIDGDLIDKMGQNPPHSFAIKLLQEWLASIFGVRRCQIQSPIEVSVADQERSLPEPDIAVLTEWKVEYAKRHPRGDELVLALEVADNSASVDLNRKATMYAAAGVPEYWVLDLIRRRLVVHRQPGSLGYKLVQFLAETDTISLENCSERIRVSDLLPTA